MLAAFLTTFLWAASVVCAWRSSKLIGGTEANFWRLLLALVLLAVWSITCGHGLFGPGLGLFIVSGMIGVGIGDTSMFQALPQLGSRLTLLLMNCLTPMFGALIEWLWLGTTLTSAQMLCGMTILAGVAIALAPARHLDLPRRVLLRGIAFTALAALAGAAGAVLSRKAYAVVHATGGSLDGGTAAFQRILGGFTVAAFCLLVVRRREIKAGLSGNGPGAHVSAAKWKIVWPWVAANAVLGQTLGVSCYQWALEQLPTGVVLSVAAITPLTVIPFARVIEGEKPTRHSLVGSVIAVAGVIALALTS